MEYFGHFHIPSGGCLEYGISQKKKGFAKPKIHIPSHFLFFCPYSKCKTVTTDVPAPSSMRDAEVGHKKAGGSN